VLREELVVLKTPCPAMVTIILGPCSTLKQ
jgi:hypothetical protein